ncbi:hypothetical protein KFK09_012510 [Dendrobium nobile]|uniref:Uncharacterized protein n=1 Tax=Dendrobium nobile TaxID=94219 RepID=A0A8T3BFP8_DENNO|nr:hypothetical protein KFK09_012510 [Dendrobium nobile]
MVNRRSNRIIGASRSNSHQSRNQSLNQGRQASASFHPGSQNPVREGTSRPSLEDRMRKMEDSHNEILQLLRETRGPTLAPQEDILLPRDPPEFEDVLHVEVPLPTSRMRPPTRPENELADTASSTHPSRVGRQHHIPPDAPEDLARRHIAELPRNALRHELRRLVREEFPVENIRQSLRHRDFQDSSPLTEAILQHPIPARFKLPNIDSYGGTSDPYEHIDHYRTIMHIQQASDALLCQVFPSTLKGQART